MDTFFDMRPLTKPEIERYSRQIRLSEIGPRGQLLIMEAKVLVIGAGGLGCPVLQYLCAAGIGILGIVDNDWIDSSNLPRQLLYNHQDIGKPKPLVAKEKLLYINPATQVNTYFTRLGKDNALRIFEGYDIIVDCTDNFASRYLISDAAVLLSKPVVYGAANQLIGQATVLNYKQGPTLRCICPTPPHPLDIPSCSDSGVMNTLTSIIGGIQATEVIKIILGSGQVLSGRFLVFDASDYSTQILTFNRDKTSIITELGNYDDLCLEAGTEVNEISAETFLRLQQDYPDILLVDLRDPLNKNDLPFPHLSIPYYEISDHLDVFTRCQAVVFYCSYGIMSAKVIHYLQSTNKQSKLFSLRLDE